jgi:hypothetical protein
MISSEFLRFYPPSFRGRLWLHALAESTELAKVMFQSLIAFETGKNYSVGADSFGREGTRANLHQPPFLRDYKS